MIDGALFQDEVEERQIMARADRVPERHEFGQGRMSLEEILAKLDTGARRARSARRSPPRTPFDVLIVGGGPAGAAAAIYAARKGIRTGVVAERFGGQVLDTLGIENFISVKETEGPKFAAGARTARAQLRRRHHEPAARRGADAGRRLIEVQARERRGAEERRPWCIATGARWREINVPGEHEYRNKGVAYCPHCDGPLFKGKRVAVIGGGNSGVEAAIDLAGIVAHVTLIEFDAQLRADAVLQRKLRSLPNVDVITNAQTTEITGDGRRSTAWSTRTARAARCKRVELEGVFVQIGLVPNTDWLKGTVELSQHGEIVVDAHGPDLGARRVRRGRLRPRCRSSRSSSRWAKARRRR